MKDLQNYYQNMPTSSMNLEYDRLLGISSIHPLHIEYPDRSRYPEITNFTHKEHCQAILSEQEERRNGFTKVYMTTPGSTPNGEVTVGLNCNIDEVKSILLDRYSNWNIPYDKEDALENWFSTSFTILSRKRSKITELPF